MFHENFILKRREHKWAQAYKLLRLPFLWTRVHCYQCPHLPAHPVSSLPRKGSGKRVTPLGKYQNLLLSFFAQRYFSSSLQFPDLHVRHAGHSVTSSFLHDCTRSSYLLQKKNLKMEMKKIPQTYTILQTHMRVYVHAHTRTHFFFYTKIGLSAIMFQWGTQEQHLFTSIQTFLCQPLQQNVYATVVSSI